MHSLPAPIQSVLDLFETALADVRFPDLDAQTLARLAADVEAAAEAVATAQASLDSSRRALQERQDTLLQQVQRAVAYARVYAESDEVLSARLDAITLARPARRARASEDALVLSPAPQPPSRPRGRSHKPPAGEPLLAASTTTAE